jgi:hypothetical protein
MLPLVTGFLPLADGPMPADRGDDLAPRSAWMEYHTELPGRVTQAGFTVGAPADDDVGMPSDSRSAI